MCNPFARNAPRCPDRSRAARPLDDDDDILRDGGHIRCPSRIMDATSFAGRGGGTFTDALGKPDAFALNRPGYRFVADNAHLDNVRETAAYALEKRRQADANAWRSRPAASPAASQYETFALSDAKKALAASRDPDRVREARALIDAAAWRNPPQMPVERRDASRGTSGSSRPPNASTVATAWSSIKSDYTPRLEQAATEDLQAEANTAREERYARDREAWRGG